MKLKMANSTTRFSFIPVEDEEDLDDDTNDPEWTIDEEEEEENGKKKLKNHDVESDHSEKRIDLKKQLKKKESRRDREKTSALCKSRKRNPLGLKLSSKR
jgi:hypothetical protein